MESKNITFDGMSKTKAKKVLEESNYYFKLTAYRKNFHKNPSGKYIKLDFNYLVDLSTIDMRLRYIVLQMSLDIEHALKNMILNDIAKDKNEDGYQVVADFLAHESIQLNKYMHPMKEESHYNNGLYKSYSDDCPIWVLFEIIPFGGLVKFLEFYYIRKNKPKKYKDLYSTLRYVKNVRNSAAHSNPILMDVVHAGQIDGDIIPTLTNFVKNVGISKVTWKKRLTNRKVHDLTALLYVHKIYVKSKGMRAARYSDLLELVHNRCPRLKNEYAHHPQLVSVYNYFVKLVDFCAAEE